MRGARCAPAHAILCRAEIATSRLLAVLLATPQAVGCEESGRVGHPVGRVGGGLGGGRVDRGGGGGGRRRAVRARSSGLRGDSASAGAEDSSAATRWQQHQRVGSSTAAPRGDLLVEISSWRSPRGDLLVEFCAALRSPVACGEQPSTRRVRLRRQEAGRGVPLGRALGSGRCHHQPAAGRWGSGGSRGRDSAGGT